MHISKLTRALGFLFFLLAGVTWVAGETGQGVSGRITIADLVGLLIIGLWIAACVNEQKFKLRVPDEYKAFIPLFLVFLLGVAFALYPIRGALELVVHLFIFVVSLVLYNLYSRMKPGDAVAAVLGALLWAGGGLAIVGLIDFFIWPSLLPGLENGLTGTFRNTGQAGSFFGTYLAVLLPAFLSGLLRATRVNIVLFLSIFFALIFTSKRAAIVGLALGLMLVACQMLLSTSIRDKRIGVGMIVLTVVVAPLAYYMFLWGLDNIEGMAWRFGRKFSQSAVVGFQEGFLMENLRAARHAMSINPLIGVGLANVPGQITETHEIHSTYLALLGNAGILGFVAYVGFIGTHIWRVVKVRGKSPYARYLRYYLPMLAGLMASWAYTYHLRKREFWILFFVVVLVTGAARSMSESCRNPQIR